MKLFPQLIILSVISTIMIPAIAQESKVLEKKIKPEIVKKFTGIWAENNGDCQSVKNGTAPGIFIDSKVIDLGPEGSCNIRSVTKSEANYFSGNFLCTSEGSTDKANYSFQLKSNEEIIVTGWGDKARNFNKCKK